MQNNSTNSIKASIGDIIEGVIVLTLGFGLFIYSSTISLSQNISTTTSQTYTSYDFVFIVTYEIIVLIFIAYFLKYRKWNLKDFNLDFKLKMIGIAILLVVLKETTGTLLIKILTLLNVFEYETTRPDISLHVNAISIVLITVINSIYEELLLIGYIFKRFEKYNTVIIILVSFVVRASFHTYQGWLKLPMVFIMAIIFGLYYIKYKKLWPIIIAHGIGNGYYFLTEQ
jgi:membrane protease YdiL (CAAX protease family)